MAVREQQGMAVALPKETTQNMAKRQAAAEVVSADQLETFPNPNTSRNYSIEIVCPEFTSLCPRTGQPDFGTITFTYTPGPRCVELKSLKLYLQRFRDLGIFYESVVNRMLDDFVAACAPRHCRVVGAFTPRGGITTTVTCVYSETGQGAGSREDLSEAEA
jgi:7-cyano-7-deazaguanine reductase